MKNSFIKRSVTGALAVAMVFSSFSCSEKKDGGNNNNGNSNNENSTAKPANEVIQNSYSSIDIETECPAEYLDQVLLIKDTAQILLTGGDSAGNTMLYLTDIDFSGFNEISLDFEKPENSQSYIRTTVSPDGSIYALLTVIDYGDFKLPDYDDPNFDYENFDYEAMDKAAKYSYTLYKLGSDGKIISQNDIKNIEKYSEDSEDIRVSIRDITAGSDGNIILSLSGEQDTYCVMNENGEISGKIDNSNMQWINFFGMDSDGKVVCAGYDDTGETLKYIDTETKKFSDSGISEDDLSKLSGITGISPGTGEYTLFVTTSTGLYGVDKDKKMVEIINWVDSDIQGDSVRFVIGLEDGDFITYLQDYSSNTSGFARLTKRSAEELANQTVITIGMLYSDSQITSKITDFNKSQTDYRIKIADYNKYNEYDDSQQKFTNSAQKQLKMDIVSGNAPDMIISYDFSLISELAPKGTFTDLSTYLEKDETLSTDDIMPNVLKASKIGGKLYSLSPTFTVATYACKSKFFDKENWTLDDLIETYHKNPDMQLMQYTNSKESVFETLIGCCDSLIDYDKAECNFDSDEFKKILEFCNEFPDEDEEIDWETATQEEMDAYYQEQENMCMNDKALLSGLSFYDFTAYKQAEMGTFNDDITLVGIPSEDGKGSVISMNDSFAILESSPSKDACWEFIKTFFTDDYFSHLEYVSSMPSLVTAFDKMAEDSMKKRYYLDENDEKIEYDNTFYVNGREITIDPLTEEEKDSMVDYKKNTDRRYNYISTDVRDIITEEVTKYFKGEATTKDVVEKLQSRIRILLSEQS